ncbi:phosphonate ABC transporter substrate-binding protein [Pseudochelatococcus sp. B33]
MKNVLLTVAVTATLALAGPAHAQDWKENYKTIRFGILSGENEKDRIKRHEKFEAYLEKQLGVDVEIFTAGNYDGVVQAIAADQIEFAEFGSSSYAAAWTETQGGVEPILAEVNAEGSSGYFSVVTVRCDSGYKSIEDLKGKVLAFADPDSTSGYAVPFFNLLQQGYDPNTYFSAIPFSGSHETGVMGVYNKQYDASATSIRSQAAGTPQNMVEKGMVPADSICWIWTSPEITNGPVTARKNLPAELIEAVKIAIRDLPKNDPEAFEEKMGGRSDAVGYVDVNHDRYQWIVDMREWLREQRRKG